MQFLTVLSENVNGFYILWLCVADTMVSEMKVTMFLAKRRTLIPENERTRVLSKQQEF